ncbi:MAG: AraC family transcriptional regulator ligand-binding domain-containing protein [Pseudomonadota bacterium]
MKIPAAYLKLYLDSFADQPPLIAAVLAGSGLDRQALASSDRDVPFEAVAQVIENANKALDEGWHVRLAADMQIMQHGPVGIAAATAPDLRGAVATVARFVEVRAPFVWLERAERDGQAWLRCFETVDLGPLRTSLMETAVVACANLIRQVGAQGDEGLSLELPGPQPAYAAAFEARGLGQPRFSASGYAVTFPAAWLSRPSLLYDRAMHDTAVGKCRQLLNAAARRSDLEFAICELLHDAGGRSPGLEAVAAHLNLSPRSLLRKLSQRGTTFRELVQGVHKTLAKEALLNGDEPVADIGYRLGYSDASNFGRAFRRWYGVSPGHYRQGRGR